MPRTSRFHSLALAALFIAVLSGVAGESRADWIASGRFVYVDREYDQTGFTGAEPQLPIRFADVEIVDSGAKSAIGKGKTDANGYYSFNVVDSKTRTVYARVNTQSTATSDLFVAVQQNTSGTIKYYSVQSTSKSKHSPTANHDFGTKVATKGAGGEAFNIYDQLVRGADYVKFLTGSRPGSTKDIKAVWASNRGVTGSSYTPSSRTISLRDTAGYDDTPILHEMGHYFQYEYSASDSPGGAHTFSDCNIDLRLAFDEGFATYWGNSVLRHHSLARCNIYTRTSGGSGAGNLVRYADLETDTQYLCKGATSEVSVFTVLWDINDSTATTDTTQGTEDAHDALSLADSQVWEVMRDAIPVATDRTAEDFWDGWFKTPISNGFKSQMLNVWRHVSIDYSEDAFEVNNTGTSAKTITVGAAPIANTFFYDPDGDGAGQADTDWFVFSATSGRTYRVETSNLVSDGDTFVELVDSDRSTVLASNDNRAAGDKSSLLDWTAPRSGSFYVRVTRSPGFGIYGAYSLSVNQL